MRNWSPSFGLKMGSSERGERENLLNDKVVFPIVSEVVHVGEARLLVSH